MNAEIEFQDIFVTDKMTLITSADIITSAAADAQRAQDYADAAADSAASAAEFEVDIDVENETMIFTLGGSDA